MSCLILPSVPLEMRTKILPSVHIGFIKSPKHNKDHDRTRIGDKSCLSIAVQEDAYESAWAKFIAGLQNLAAGAFLLSWLTCSFPSDLEDLKVACALRECLLAKLVDAVLCGHPCLSCVCTALMKMPCGK